MKRSIVARLFFMVSCLALIVGLIVTHIPLQARAASPGSSLQITCGQWNLIPVTSNNSILWAVTGITLTDAWAVGWMETSSNTVRVTLTMHWDGTAWSSVPSPNLPGNDNKLNSVTALASNDVWAVGQGTPVTGPTQALIEHWDGTSWTIVPSPNDGVSSFLNGVTAVPGTNELWAVGGYSGNGSNNALLEHWDGTQWTQFFDPSLTSNIAYLQSVTAFSSTDVWAVGFSNNAGIGQTLIEHWDGTSWSIVPSPNWSSVSNNVLFNVTPVPNTNELWAVGYYDTPNTNRALYEYWDGSTWHVIPGTKKGASVFLVGIAAVASNDVWSVGYHGSRSLVEHWDGTSWSMFAQPESTVIHSFLWGIGTTPNQTYVWAVGDFYRITTKIYHPVILLYC